MIWNILIFILIFIATIFLFSRVLKEMQLLQIVNMRDKSRSFNRKLEFIRQKEYRRHTLALLVLSFLLLITMALMTVRFLKLEDNYRALQQQQMKIKEDFQLLKQEKTELTQNLPIYPYPKEGLDLKSYNWEELRESQDSKILSTIELKMAQQLTPYFGVTTLLVIFNSSTQTLYLNLILDVIDQEKREKILENIKSFIVEAEELSLIGQINVQLKNVVDPTLEINEYYIRENTEGKFKKISNPIEAEKEEENKKTEGKIKEKEQKGAVEIGK
ncbi:hypothetical protein ACYSNO_00735 [Enterococcus sp. LJL98]